MNIVIDIGNTFSKLGIYINGKREKVYHGLSDYDLIGHVKDFEQGRGILATVREDFRFLEDHLKIEVLVLDSETRLPITNRYETPATLGVDRLAGVVGANSIFPDTNCLVIDVGTAITYDFINQEGEFLGGGISPGPEMRLKALNNYTDNLPMIESLGSEGLIGKSTRGSILSGVFEGTWAEIQGIISGYNEKFSELQVIMCGGGLNHFESRIKEPIFVAPEIVLDGLNRILEYNVGEES